MKFLGSFCAMSLSLQLQRSPHMFCVMPARLDAAWYAAPSFGNLFPQLSCVLELWRASSAAFQVSSPESAMFFFPVFAGSFSECTDTSDPHGRVQNMGGRGSTRGRRKIPTILVCPSLSVNIGSGASLSKEATLSPVCERTRRRDCVKSESMTTQGWYDGTWNEWCWKSLDHWSSSSSSKPRAGWMWYKERHSPWLNQGSPQWNLTVDTKSSDPRQYGDGWDEVIPSFDGTDFRQYERRVRLFLSHTRVAPERRAGKLVERLDGRAFDLCEGVQDLETPNCVENLLDHLRMHYEPIDVFRQGRVVDDFVGDFERQPGEEADEYEPLWDAMLTAVPQARALRGVENSRERTLPK